MKSTLIKNKDTLKFSPYQMARLEDLLANGKSFIDDSRFKDKNFCDKLMTYKGPEIDTAWFFNHMNSLDGVNKTEHSEKVILNTKQEELLFLKYNYVKKSINSISKLNVFESYSRLLELDDIALAVRDKLVGANLGLVLSIARNNNFPCVDFTESLGEGHIALIDSIEKFNVTKGKFSTYFTRSFTNALIKLNAANIKLSSNNVKFDPTLHERSEEDNSENLELLELINEFLSGNTNLLTEDELFVLRKKYIEGMTLADIGLFYDPVKTKGQVFYVEKTARLKIKDALTDML